MRLRVQISPSGHRLYCLKFSWFPVPPRKCWDSIVTWMSDYRRGLDWQSDLWDCLIQRDYVLLFTISHTHTHTHTHTRTHTHTHTSFHSHVFTSHCLVAVSNGGRSPSSWFPKCSRPQLPASHSNSSQKLNPSSPLTNSLTYQPTNLLTHWLVLFTTSRHRPHRKHLSSVAVQLLPWRHACLRSRYLATAVI
jgi:hypothetical protein